MRIQYFLFFITVVTYASCTKSNLNVDKPSINISLSDDNSLGDTFVYHIGDTVSFKISGSVDNLSFYPGISGYNYDNRNRVLLDSVNPVLSFASELQWGTQLNTLQVLATSKLPSLDSSDIVNGNWTDITDRAILSTSATVVPSGNINLKDIVASPEDTLYIAFKYFGITGSTQRTWTITNYSINNVFPDQTVNITTIANEASYWTMLGKVDGFNEWTATSAQLQMIGGAAAAPTRTTWIVSRPMVVGSVSNDISIPVKSVTDADIYEYDYVYNIAGTYKAVWLAFNSTSKDQKSVVKEFYIKVE